MTQDNPSKQSFVKCGDWFTLNSPFELCNRVSSSIRVVEHAMKKIVVKLVRIK